MLTKLIICSNLNTRQDAILNQLSDLGFNMQNPDLLLFRDEDKLGVEQAKKIREYLSIKGYIQGRGVGIVSAHNLTPDAQNALLKTLEEPPENAVIVLGVEKTDQLLSTVVSRCEIEYLAGSGKREVFREEDERISELFSMSITERFIFIEKLEEKEEFLDDLVAYFHKKLPHNLDYSKKLLQAQEWKSANGNIRAILEHLTLELPDQNYIA